jgi:hypothetical protein
MAHFLELGISDAPFLADVDLTTCQYRFVMPASTAYYVTGATGASNPAPLGVLQNSPSQGQEARVRVLGFSKVVAVAPSGCGLAYGRYFSTSTVGQAVPTASETGMPIYGRWLDSNLAVSSSMIGMVLLSGAFGTCPVSAS